MSDRQSAPPSRWRRRREQKALLKAHKMMWRAYFATDDPTRSAAYHGVIRTLWGAMLHQHAIDTATVPDTIPQEWTA